MEERPILTAVARMLRRRTASHLYGGPLPFGLSADATQDAMRQRLALSLLGLVQALPFAAAGTYSHPAGDAAELYAVRRAEVDVAVVQFVGELDGVDFEPVLSSPRVAVVSAWSQLAEASFLTSDDLAALPWLEVGGREPLLASWVGSARDAAAPCVRHPAAIPTAVATTGRVSLHAAAAARYYPRPDVRFVPGEGPPVEIAVATRSGDRRSAVAAFRRAAAIVHSLPAA